MLALVEQDPLKQRHAPIVDVDGLVELSAELVFQLVHVSMEGAQGSWDYAASGFAHRLEQPLLKPDAKVGRVMMEASSILGIEGWHLAELLSAVSRAEATQRNAVGALTIYQEFALIVLVHRDGWRAPRPACLAPRLLQTTTGIAWELGFLSESAAGGKTGGRLSGKERDSFRLAMNPPPHSSRAGTTA